MGFLGCGEQGLFVAVAALVMELGLQARGLQYLGHTGLVALRQVRSSQTGVQTAVPCIARQTANRWTTRETLKELLKSKRTHENQTQGHPPGAGLDQGESLFKGCGWHGFTGAQRNQGLGWEDWIKIPGRRIRRKKLKDFEDNQEDQR